MRTVQTLRAGPLQSRRADASADGDCEVSKEHLRHFEFDRALQRSSHSICSVVFSPDGGRLFSGSASGDIRAWDTSSWTEVGVIRASRGEDICTLAFSPSQRWLVALQPTALHVFGAWAPWGLEHSASPPGGATGQQQQQQQQRWPEAGAGAATAAGPAGARWRCAAFAPAAAVATPPTRQGGRGPVQHLAALSTGFLCVMDCSAGWAGGAPQRTHSLPGSAQPTCLVYTACGGWIALACEDGLVQVWSAKSLILERSVRCEGAVRCLAASPQAAAYESRLVAGGADSTLHVWCPSRWVQEEVVTDPPSGKSAIHGCSFSASGAWLVSVGRHFCVWRVGLNRGGGQQLSLQLHQRLEDACGAQGLRAAAVRGPDDFIAVGSFDGLLGLWAGQAGLPRPRASPEGSPATPASRRVAPRKGRTMMV
eukprot:CAMPEP_0175537634 /NCGR_PEP_ID=MMETSP0096-20121207/25317_1 /TAXON_ID=311494 /ORGANISM="Alexandrium monilatum, Strain CCMP3105" /LENGTH=423 /DNA_ID=CAMNT_0016840471 /DNA_START=24 /DNA_END=1292 /DNA_ORIENTATION=-